MNDYFRSEAIRALAKDQPCQRCGREDGTTVSAHSNSHKHGKGGKIKAHDCFIAWLCNQCHYEIDNGKTMTKEERYDEWESAYIRTMPKLFALLKVK